MSKDAMREFLVSLTIDHDVRRRFASDAEGVMNDFGLSEKQKTAIHKSDKKLLDEMLQSLQAGSQQ